MVASQLATSPLFSLLRMACRASLFADHRNRCHHQRFPEPSGIRPGGPTRADSDSCLGAHRRRVGTQFRADRGIRQHRVTGVASAAGGGFSTGRIGVRAAGISVS